MVAPLRSSTTCKPSRPCHAMMLVHVSHTRRVEQRKHALLVWEEHKADRGFVLQLSTCFGVWGYKSVGFRVSLQRGVQVALQLWEASAGASKPNSMTYDGVKEHC